MPAARAWMPRRAYTIFRSFLRFLSDVRPYPGNVLSRALGQPPD